MPENKFARTCAHELGYGVFTLRHTFSDKAKYIIAQGQTDNLMDYKSAKYPIQHTLHKWQWDRVHNSRKISITGGDEKDVAQDVIGDEHKLFSI